MKLPEGWETTTIDGRESVTKSPKNPALECDSPQNRSSETHIEIALIERCTTFQQTLPQWQMCAFMTHFLINLQGEAVQWLPLTCRASSLDLQYANNKNVIHLLSDRAIGFLVETPSADEIVLPEEQVIPWEENLQRYSKHLEIQKLSDAQIDTISEIYTSLQKKHPTLTMIDSSYKAAQWAQSLTSPHPPLYFTCPTYGYFHFIENINDLILASASTPLDFENVQKWSHRT